MGVNYVKDNSLYEFTNPFPNKLSNISYLLNSSYSF